MSLGRNKRVVIPFVVGTLLLAWCGAGSAEPAESPTQKPTSTWTFDRQTPGSLPSDFQIGTLFDGKPGGDWKVVQSDQAKSPPRVIAQLMPKGAEHAYKTVFIKGRRRPTWNLRRPSSPSREKRTWEAALSGERRTRQTSSVSPQPTDRSVWSVIGLFHDEPVD